MTVDLLVAGKLAIDELSFQGKAFPPVLGGSAAHVALAASTVGRTVAVISSIGSDFPSHFLHALEVKGVNLSGVVQREGLSSHFWANFAVNGTMDRYRMYFGVGNQLSMRHFTRLANDAKAIHLGILPPHLQRKFIKKIHSRGKILSMTTIFHQAKKIREKILPQLQFLDILFLNVKEAKFLSNQENHHTAIEQLGKLVPLVIVTEGSGGCLVNHFGAIRHIESYRVKEIDATGAGDSFAGAFLARYLTDENVEEAAKWGNAAGALNVQQIGSTRLLTAKRHNLKDLITNSQ
ncbi:MAG: carbohydrate kinase family protein [Candidatus Thorarchaeota archaeon]